MKKTAIGMIVTLGLLSASNVFGSVFENFPSNNENASLYYQMGGGRSVPIPAVQNDTTVPIDASGDVGLGFSCGKFNPVATITNSLNDFKDSVQNVSQSIISRATSAITSFPMYKLAQADPKLYEILNNNIIGSHDQFSLRMKSCESMQSEALKGQDPYSNWLSVSNNDNMKHVMAFGDGDLNKAMSKVNHDQGENGVPWATPGKALGNNAGGQGQAPIMVVHDTSIAGYNVMLNRNPTDLSSPGSASDNQSLLNYWGSPIDSAKWIVSVVGDEKVTTCTGSDCSKSSSPGQGLLPYIQSATKQITTDLLNLVENPGQVTEKSLLAVSAPGQVISKSILQNIRLMNSNAQGNTIATLAQNIATTRVINEALLAITVLRRGSQVPAIHAATPAQTELKEKISLLQSDINQIMYTIKIRRTLDSHVMEDIIDYGKEQQAQAASLPQTGTTPALLQNGAIVKGEQGL